MAGLFACRASQSSPYSGTAVASLRLAAVLTFAMSLSGCAVSGVGSMFSKSSGNDARAEATEETTGSIGQPASSTSTSGLPSESDLVFTRLAVVDVLKRGSREVSSPWENPSSGARGTVTPIASVYERDGLTCRDFLASYVRRQGSDMWMQGEACRAKRGDWAVKSLRPWSRS